MPPKGNYCQIVAIRVASQLNVHFSALAGEESGCMTSLIQCMFDDGLAAVTFPLLIYWLSVSVIDETQSRAAESCSGHTRDTVHGSCHANNILPSVGSTLSTPGILNMGAAIIATPFSKCKINIVVYPLKYQVLECVL